MCQNSTHDLNQLVHNVSIPQGQTLPTYAALKQALLCDWYKRRKSIQVDPKTLKVLLTSKLMSEPLDLLQLRRYSDPGSYIQSESFARRKELFIDENRTWSQTHGKVIEQKVLQWKTIREEKRRQKLLSWKNSEFQQQGLKYHLFNQLQQNSVPPNAHMFPAGLVPNGINSYVYPQTILTASSGTHPTQAPSSVVYSSFIPSYPFVNPYQPLLQVGQPTIYVPQAQNQQKVVYLVPPSSNGPATHPLGSLNNPNQLPSLTRKRSDSGIIGEEDYHMKDNFRRRQSVPNNLSSLLVSPLRQMTPDSPPLIKRMRLTEEPPPPPLFVQDPSNQQQQQQQQLSSRQHHLLQVHRRQRNGENGLRSRSPSRSPAPSPRSASRGSIGNPIRQIQNGISIDSDYSDVDDEEAEAIVGGAILSPKQHSGYGGMSILI